VAPGDAGGQPPGADTLPDPKSAATPDRILRIGRPTGGIQDLTVQGQHAASPLPSRCAEPRRSHSLVPGLDPARPTDMRLSVYPQSSPARGGGPRRAAAWWRGMHLSATGKPRTGIPLHHRLRRRSPSPCGGGSIRAHSPSSLRATKAARQSGPPRASHPGLDRVPRLSPGSR